jgi:ribonuclease P protein component
MTTRLRFPKTRRLSGNKVFDAVFAAKRNAATRLLVVYALSNRLAYSRLGISVSRRIGPAVRRNRIKRLIREAFRLERDRLPAGFDFVCVARASEKPVLADYRKALVSAAARAAAVRPRPPRGEGGAGRVAGSA